MQVKFPPFFLVAGFVLISSCSKTDIKTNSTPAGSDTVVLIKPDTVSLIKQSTTYDFAADGVTVQDSNQLQWKYDNQRRIAQAIFAGADYQDTGTYTYSGDRDVISSVAFLNRALGLKTDYITYHHVLGVTDSITVQNTGYGPQAGIGNLSTVYFYYNQDGLDSIEKSYNTVNNLTKFNSSVSYYYSGGIKDSVVGRDDQGTTSYIKYYTDGNESGNYIFNSGVLAGMTTITYTNISTGPLANFLGATKLQSGSTDVTVPATLTYTETDTYQFDSQNRVSIVLRNHYGTSPNEKQTYSYY